MWGLAKVKMYVISDNIDTQTGMRLAGVEGVVVHEHDETVEALHRAIADGDIAIILITEKLAKLVSREMDALKADSGFDYKVCPRGDRSKNIRSEGV